MLLPGARPLWAQDDASRTPRERIRPGAGVYLQRGLEYLSRPRPEDQDEADRLFRKALSLEPDLARAHAGMARSAIYRYNLGLDQSEERLAIALEEAHRAVELAPDDAVSRATMALALATADRLTPALVEARRATSLDPDSAPAQVALSVVLRLLKKHEEALASARRAAALEPDSPRVLTALADTLRDNELYGEAIELYGQAIDLDHEAIVPQMGAAATFHKSGRLGRAGQAYENLLDQWDYARERALQGVGAVQVGLQNYESALEIYSRIDLPSGSALPNLLTLYAKGYCLMRLGRPAEAEYFLTSLIDRVPHEYDGSERGREILFRAYEDVVRYFEERGRDRKVDRLLRAASGRPLAPTRLAARLATRLEAAGKTPEALEILSRAILGSSPLEDVIDLAASAMVLARVGSAGGRRTVHDDGQAGEALRLAAERIAAGSSGVAFYRLARAQALARHTRAALASLARARQHGYLPADRLAAEPDFEKLRDEEAFRDLVDR